MGVAATVRFALHGAITRRIKWPSTHLPRSQIILLAVDPIAGTLEYASYGESKTHCNEAKRLADVAYQAIMDKYEEE